MRVGRWMASGVLASVIVACSVHPKDDCTQTLECAPDDGGLGGEGGLGAGDGGVDPRLDAAGDAVATCDAQADSATNPCVVDDDGIFVAVGGDDTNAGTKDAPLAHLATALARVQHTGRRVFACADAPFSEPLTIDQSPTVSDDTVVVGGFTCKGGVWAYAAGKPTEIAPMVVGVPALTIANHDRVSLTGLAFLAPPLDPATVSQGTSSIAGVVTRSSNVRLTNCQFTAADARDGAAGPPGATVVAPAGALDGDSGEVNRGGGATTNAACGAGGNSVGSGGGNPPGSDGTNGLPKIDPPSNSNLTGVGGAHDVGTCTGFGGSDGVTGTGGGGAATNGSFGTRWATSDGSDGKAGGTAQGGGGGASLSAFGGGGGGGAGGCGGGGGTHGSGGGSSIALIVANADAVTLEGVRLTAGRGGAGGDGGQGGNGQNGGRLGAAGGMPGAACSGGVGGTGGSGGGGGGGAGGVSVGLVWLGSTSAQTPTLDGKPVNDATVATANIRVAEGNAKGGEAGKGGPISSPRSNNAGKNGEPGTPGKAQPILNLVQSP